MPLYNVKPSVFGYPYNFDPSPRSTDNFTWATANTGVYYRAREGGVLSKIGLVVGTQSGNISVAVYTNSGAGRAAVPGTRLATSGAVACPAAGYAEISLGASVVMAAGDWLALSCDNATATFRCHLASAADSDLALGRALRQATAHPLPSTVGTLVAVTGWNVVLVGAP